MILFFYIKPVIISLTFSEVFIIIYVLGYYISPKRVNTLLRNIPPCKLLWFHHSELFKTLHHRPYTSEIKKRFVLSAENVIKWEALGIIKVGYQADI